MSIISKIFWKTSLCWESSLDVLSLQPKTKIKLLFLFNFSDLPKASTKEGIFFLLTALEIVNIGGFLKSFKKGSIILSISEVSVVEWIWWNLVWSTPGAITLDFSGEKEWYWEYWYTDSCLVLVTTISAYFKDSSSALIL